VPYIVAEPLPSNLLEWHYVVRGPDDSPYRGNRNFPIESHKLGMLRVSRIQPDTGFNGRIYDRILKMSE
jgi:hypothetical protein